MKSIKRYLLSAMLLVCFCMIALVGCDIPFLGGGEHEHTLVEHEAKAPTCLDDGWSKYYTCSECDYTTFEATEKLGHEFSYTSSEDNTHVRSCIRCIYIVEEEHTWEEGPNTLPTCEENGACYYSCVLCGEGKTEIISALGHTYSDNYEPDGDTHARTCLGCGHIVTDSHSWDEGRVEKEPTCIEKGAFVYECTVCGAEKREDIPTLDTHVWDEGRVEKEPNCTETGIMIYACTFCGETKSETMPTVDQHYDGEWEIIQSPTATVDGYKVLHCVFCNIVIGQEVLSADAKTMPTIYMVGDYASATAAKNEVQMAISYVDPNGQSFDGYALIKVQGASSVKYPKKNYTIKFYKDDQCDKKLKVDLGWGKESKYVMKANWVDFIQARNIVSCRLWGDMVASRNASSLQERLASLSTNGGAIDGYPISVYMNGEFYGIYTMNVPKDEWMFDMGDSETEALITADDWLNTDFSKLLTEFTENSAGDLVANDGGWELKYYGTEDTTGDTTWVTNSFNRLILFCQQNEGEEFKAGISQYMDIDSAIDYLIHMYVIYMRDNTSKNMIWATYDGQVWFPSVYDQDGTFGMVWDGKRIADANKDLPIVTDDGKIDVNCPLGSGQFILWDRMWNAFTEEILVRYQELRQTVLSDENIIAEFEAFRACIPESVYVADIEKWQSAREDWWDNAGGVWYEKFDYEYIYEWMGSRLDYMDEAMRNIYDNVYLPSVDNPVL